jgi:hypothetical protein
MESVQSDFVREIRGKKPNGNPPDIGLREAKTEAEAFAAAWNWRMEIDRTCLATADRST